MSAPVRTEFDFGPYPCTNEQEDRILRERAVEQRRLDAEDLENLQSMAAKALAGAYGKQAQRVAQERLPNPSCATRWALEDLRKALRKVPGRTSA